MTNDERTIRNLVATWMTASEQGHLQAVHDLMDDDMIFTVPGAEPFGKEKFAAMFKGMKDVRMQATADIRELRVLGDWAFVRNFIELTITSPGGSPQRRAGYTLTALGKTPDGRWVLLRDANLVTPQD